MTPDERSVVRRGPLNRAQGLEWWDHHSRNPQSDEWTTNSILTMPVPKGISRAEISGALALLAERHEALRTTIDFDSSGEPIQLVHDPYEPAVFELESRGPDSRVHLINAVARHRFRIAEELPVFAGILVLDDEPVELSISTPHVLSDRGSRDILSEELGLIFSSVTRGDTPSLPERGHNPLDIAATESSPAGITRAARSERHISEGIAARPNRNLLGAEGEHTSATTLLWRSDTSPMVFDAVSRQVKSTAPQLYTTAVHAIVHLISGGTRSHLRSHFSGRFGTIDRAVGCFASQVFTTIDFSDEPSFSEILRRGGKALTTSQRNHSYDYFDYRRLQALEERSRGAILTPALHVNFAQGEERHFKEDSGCGTTVVQERAMRDQSGFEAYTRVFWGRDTASAEGTFNDSALSLPEMKLLLEGPEIILSEFIERGDLAYGEIARLLEVPQNSRISREWVSPTVVHSPTATERLIMLHPDVQTVRTFVEHGQLTAYVLTHQGTASPQELRAFTLAELRPWIPAVCPNRFVICSAPPEQIDDLDSWSRVPRIAEGSGLEELKISPVTDAARVLAEAVASINELADVDLASSYVEAGGSVTRIVKVLQAVRDRGYDGLSADSLLGPSSLQRIALSLTASRL